MAAGAAAAMNSAYEKTCIDLIEEYEKKYINLVESINTGLHWTIGCLVTTLLFNMFLLYCLTVTCDRLRKLRHDLDKLQVNLMKGHQSIAKNVRMLVRLNTKMDNEHLSGRIDRVIDHYNGGFTLSSPTLGARGPWNVLPTITPSAPLQHHDYPGCADAPALPTSTPASVTPELCVPEKNISTDTAALLPRVTASFATSEPTVTIEEGANPELVSFAEKYQREFDAELQRRLCQEDQVQQWREMKNKFSAAFKRKPP